MFAEQLRRAVEAAPRAELPARVAHPLLPFPRPAPRSVRCPFTPSLSAGPYRLPHDVRDRLAAALTPFRNRDAAFALATFLGRFWSTPARLLAAFPIDRRELAGHAALASLRRASGARSARWRRSGFSTAPWPRVRPTGRHRTGCTASRCCSCSGATTGQRVQVNGFDWDAPHRAPRSISWTEQWHFGAGSHNRCGSRSSEHIQKRQRHPPPSRSVNLNSLPWERLWRTRHIACFVIATRIDKVYFGMR